MVQKDLLVQNLQDGLYDEKLAKIYCVEKRDVKYYSERFLNVIQGLERTFGSVDYVSLFSAPGRTELGGNHTDHQHGCVLAGSINLDVIAAVKLNDENIVRVQSEGYPMDIIDLDSLEADEKEYNQAKALIKGVIAKFKTLGYEIKGFDAYTSSNVLKGSGLSSSAAFEVLIGNIINGLFANGEVSAVDIAKIGQYAENVYFGKPCGLMDQMACSVGAAVSIDFSDTENPLIQKVDFDFSNTGYALCIIDSGADHADLTDEYAAIPKEMKAVANYFGEEYLRNVNKFDFYSSIKSLREKVGDRAVLRAIHFFEDNDRAVKEAQVLRDGHFDEFLSLVKESGYSSYMYLQNVCVSGSVQNQAVGLVLALCQEFLQGKGAYRVHGGGFAGTVQAFVPVDMLDDFKRKIEAILGDGYCHFLSIRPIGGFQFV